LEHCDNSFARTEEAKTALYIHVLHRLETINMQNVKDRPFVFVPKMNVVHDGKRFPVAIYARFNNKDDFSHGFYIEWVNRDELDPWNQKLRNKFGENITFGLHSEIVDVEEEDEDGNPVVYTEKYYYEGLVTGKSKLYDTIEEAYEEAYWFMDNIELFVDCD
jgi:hypothetical protein